MSDQQWSGEHAGQRGGTNGLGLAGFIVSIVGLISCPLIALVGLVLSAFGMRKEPRGLAIAGLVLGIIGVLFTGVLMMGILLPAFGRARYYAMCAKSWSNAKDVGAAIERYEGNHNGTMPSALNDLVNDGLITDAETLDDAWGNPIRLVVKAGGEFELASDGRDKISGTSDDLVLYPADLDSVMDQSR